MVKKAYLLGRLFKLVMTRLFGMKACSGLGAEDFPAFTTLDRLGDGIRIIDCPTKFLNVRPDSFLIILINLLVHSFRNRLVRVGKKMIHSWLQEFTGPVSTGTQEYKTDPVAGTDVLGDPLC